MNTQLTKMLLLLTITAGFASAATIQEPIAEPDQIAEEVPFDNVPDGLRVGKIELFSGKQICDQLIHSPTWGPTLEIALSMPKPDSIEFFATEPVSAYRFTHPEWNDGYKSKVDHEELGFKKFFNESPYCPKQVADKANYELNYCLSVIKDNLTAISTFELRPGENRQAAIDRKETRRRLSQLADKLWQIRRVIYDVGANKNVEMPLDEYQKIIPTLTHDDLSTIIKWWMRSECRYNDFIDSIHNAKAFLLNITPKRFAD